MDNEMNGGHVRLFIYRIPKNNHYAIVRLNKQFIYTLENKAHCTRDSFVSTTKRA